MDKEKFILRKASDLTKKSLTKAEVYENITRYNNTSIYRHAIPPEAYISEEVILSIMQDGFKVSKGNMIGFIDAWIIEW
ncbi:hypothetical protein [Chryseobacterium lathyri]|uniref:hypothetical protein n=1 Tax=Chryseobacterium lathyri TaxID=395933 RepID=UPI001CBBFE1B|nr:hypothetical protein [Chryseobacterium lathyri]